MNTQNLPLNEEMQFLMSSIPNRQWQQFFEALRIQEYQTLRLTETDLPKLQARINVLDELEALFKSIQKPK